MKTVNTINIHHCKTTKRYVVRVYMKGVRKFVSRENTKQEALAAQLAFIKALSMVGIECRISGKKQK